MDSAKLDLPGILFSLAVLSVIAMLVLSIPVGFYTVFYSTLSSSYSYQTVVVSGSPATPSVPFYVGLLTIRIPFTVTFGELFAVLTSLCALFMGLAAWQGGGIISSFKASSRLGLRPLFNNPLAATVIILGASLLATILLDFLQTSAGIPTGGVSGDPLALLVSFTLAAFIEEIGYRFFLIGIPLFAVLLVTRAPVTTNLKALWRPSAAWDSKAAAGEGSSLEQSYKLLVIVLVGFSAIVFGLAHYLANSGWNVGKISEAALDGVALGYLYVRYGLHTAIIYHWATDFALNAFAFYGQAVHGIPWTANSAYSLVPAYDVLYVVGIPGALYMTYMIVLWASKRGSNPPTLISTNPLQSASPASAAPLTSQRGYKDAKSRRRA